MGLGKRRDMKISQGLASGMRSEPIRETHLGTEFVIDGASALAPGRYHVGTILQGNVLEYQRSCVVSDSGQRPGSWTNPCNSWRFSVSATEGLWTPMQERRELAHPSSLIRI